MKLTVNKRSEWTLRSIQPCLVTLFFLCCGFGVSTGGATTWSAPQTVQCPLDQTALVFRFPKTRFLPRMTRHLDEGVVGQTYACTRCGWVGLAHDLQRPVALSAVQRTRLLRYLSEVSVPKTVWERHERSAEIAAVIEATPMDVAHRYLQAAAAAGTQSPVYLRLRKAARDVFARISSQSVQAAYAAGELSRQLGEQAQARTHLSQVVQSNSEIGVMRTWAAQALRSLR